MRETDTTQRRGQTLVLASGATAVAALIFLVSGILSAKVSVTIGGALIFYALMVAAVAFSGFRGRRWPTGAMVYIALLHLAVGASMAKQQPFFWVLVVVSLVALVSAGRRHLADLRELD